MKSNLLAHNEALRARRETGHRRGPLLVSYETDDYAAQRGLEQLLYDQHPEAQVPGGFNRIRPISPSNPNGPAYIDAARRFLGPILFQ